MARIKHGRPALVVAVMVLIAAVAGTALAGSGPEANTSASKTAKRALKLAKKSKKVGRKNTKAINSFGASVSRGLVSAGGDLSRASKDLRVTHPGTGIYCIVSDPGVGIAPTKAVVLATSTSAKTNKFVQTNLDAPNCSGAGAVEVNILNDDSVGAGLVDHGFSFAYMDEASVG